MSLDQSAQMRILESIKENLPPHLSLVDELADLLSISKDSAYRRLRGEKSLDIQEVQLLSNHFNLSLDSLLNTSNNVLSFNTLIIDSNGFTFRDWLNNVHSLLGMVSQMDGVISYFARDLPIFHHFLFPERCGLSSKILATSSRCGVGAMPNWSNLARNSARDINATPS